jgi:flavin-dependent dehydrogenase
MSADVLVAGGGIAGSSLALMLGRCGLRVDLYERRTFPSEKPCGEGIMPGGVGVLERLGLLDQIGGETFHAVRWYAGQLLAEGRFAPTRRAPAFGVAQRRYRLDRTLFEAAASTRGVCAFAGARVDAPLVSGGRVVGLVVGGEPRRAAITVIADGAGSRLASALGLGARRTRRSRIGMRAHFGPVTSRAGAGLVEVFIGEGRELYVTPLPGGEMLVAALSDRLAVGADARGALLRWASAEPALRERLAGVPLIGAVAGRYPLSGRVRVGAIPGAVLLGDAAGWTDPITGGGMAQALLAAELLAEHLPAALERGDAVLERFDRRRRRLLRGQRWLTAAMLELLAHPPFVAPVLRGMAARPALLSRLMAVAAGARRLG